MTQRGLSLESHSIQFKASFPGWIYIYVYVYIYIYIYINVSKLPMWGGSEKRWYLSDALKMG